MPYIGAYFEIYIFLHCINESQFVFTFNDFQYTVNVKRMFLERIRLHWPELGPEHSVCPCTLIGGTRGALAPQYLSIEYLCPLSIFSRSWVILIVCPFDAFLHPRFVNNVKIKVQKNKMKMILEKSIPSPDNKTGLT